MSDENALPKDPTPEPGRAGITLHAAGAAAAPGASWENVAPWLSALSIAPATALVWWAAGASGALVGAAGMVVVATAGHIQGWLETAHLRDELRRSAQDVARLRSELEETGALLGDMVHTDAVTGARNRRFLRDSAVAAGVRRVKSSAGERRGARQQHGVGALIVDLDGFTAINAQHGHAVGDSVLQHAARGMRRCLRSADTLVRWGGDEFLILLGGADAAHSAEVAERLVEALRSNPDEIGDDVWLSLSCTVGWSHVDWHQGEREPLDAAVSAAEVALFNAQEAGGDRAAAAAAPRLARSA